MSQGLRRTLGIGLPIVIVTAAGAALAASPDLQPDEGKAGLTRHVVLDRMPEAPVCSTNPLALRFRASGASDDGAQGAGTRKEATSVHCTNFSTGPAEIEVQVIQWNGTDVYCGVFVTVAGGTTTFSTQNTTIYFDDIILNNPPGTPAIFQGSVLVWSDSAEVRCTAQVLDPLGYPPVFATTLELYP